MNCKQIACAYDGCAHTIHMHHDVERRYRRTHESFFCPAGHSQFFPGKTDEEKRIEQLQGRIDSLTRSLDRWQDIWNETQDKLEDARLDLKTCPFECGFRVHRKRATRSVRFALVEHLITAHGAEFPAVVEEEVEV